MGTITSMSRIWLTRSFLPFQFTNKNDPKLFYEDTQNLGLYVHVPFCRTLCSFCPYCKQVFEEEEAEAYVRALKDEIRLVGGALTKPKKVTTLYFGGGSPALVSKEIKGILETIKEYFEITEGVGVELHPADVTFETLTVLKNAGVTRISIGIQSFQQEYLSLLGRGSMDYGFLFDALAKVHFETVSMDFIFALPGQTIESLRRDIDFAFANGANHIAIYPFIDFTYTKRKFEKMPEQQKKKLLYDITAYCIGQGYVRDSIWTFAKPHTKKYSSMTRDNFLGFGCSATTLLSDSFKINTFSVKEYIHQIDAGNLPTALTLKFTPRQRMVYFLFWTAYTTTIEGEAFEKFFGKKLEQAFGLELLLARLFGLLDKVGDTYRLTSRGAYYYHYYENYYTLSYIDQMWSLMRIQPFPTELTLR
jgi:oxygen-independent coproporphyrinogen-3 oxidase